MGRTSVDYKKTWRKTRSHEITGLKKKTGNNGEPMKAQSNEASET